MPSIQAPTHYERAEGEMPPLTDYFYKEHVDHDFYADSTGSVESPFGFVALVEVTQDQINEFVAQDGFTAVFLEGEIKPGWFIFRTDSDGLFWALRYGDAGMTFPEENARADFHEVAAAYNKWDSSQHEYDDEPNEDDYESFYSENQVAYSARDGREYDYAQMIDRLRGAVHNLGDFVEGSTAQRHFLRDQVLPLTQVIIDTWLPGPSRILVETDADESQVENLRHAVEAVAGMMPNESSVSSHISNY